MERRRIEIRNDQGVRREEEKREKQGNEEAERERV